MAAPYPAGAPPWLPIVGAGSYARAWMAAPQPPSIAPVRVDTLAADLALVERARKGDADAQAQLVERLLPQLRVVAHALLGRSADADDAVQIGLMRVLEGLASWRGEASLQAWARRVAANACLRLAEQNRRHARGRDGDDIEELVAPQPLDAAGAQVPGSVLEYLRRLPAIQREVVVLRHVLGHSVEEIAELTGAAIGTVKSRLLEGRKALRKWVRRDDAVDEIASGLRRRASP
jgi:RNA polymerase sigma-70 factor (ECF subfamily)